MLACSAREEEHTRNHPTQCNFPQTMHASNMTQRFHTSFHRFPLSSFKYFLTLFSEFFSSFPHGTCSLSVSGQYLALDEIYHPIRVGIPTNSTLRTQTVCGELRVMNGILTLHDALFQRTYTQVTRWHYVSNVQLAKPLG